MANLSARVRESNLGFLNRQHVDLTKGLRSCIHSVTIENSYNSIYSKRVNSHVATKNSDVETLIPILLFITSHPEPKSKISEHVAVDSK